MLTLKLVPIDDSLGLVLPKEAVAKFNLQAGDTVFLTDSPEGLRLTPGNPEFDQQMDMARQIMKKRREVLHELAQ